MVVKTVEITEVFCCSGRACAVVSCMRTHLLGRQRLCWRPCNKPCRTGPVDGPCGRLVLGLSTRPVVGSDRACRQTLSKAGTGPVDTPCHRWPIVVIVAVIVIVIVLVMVVVEW